MQLLKSTFIFFITLSFFGLISCGESDPEPNNKTDTESSSNKNSSDSNSDTDDTKGTADLVSNKDPNRICDFIASCPGMDADASECLLYLPAVAQEMLDQFNNALDLNDCSLIPSNAQDYSEPDKNITNSDDNTALCEFIVSCEISSSLEQCLGFLPLAPQDLIEAGKEAMEADNCTLIPEL